MRRVLVAGLLLAAGCGTHDGPSAPTPTPMPTGVSVTHSAESTIFIDNEVQFQATVTLSDGSTQAASDVTWESDAPGVATVSSAGLMTAVAAGEATISAEVAGGRGGFLRIRVYPEFQGNWTGRGVRGLTAQRRGIRSGACCAPASWSPAPPNGVGKRRWI